MIEKEEENLEVEDIRNAIMSVFEEYFDECDLEPTSDEEKDLLRSTFNN